MNADTSPLSRTRRLLLPVLCGLLLALALVRVPTAMDVDPASSHRALLYENLRLGRAWAEACLTTEGPLTALQTPGYLTGSLWMTMGWQIAGNLLLAGVLTAAAWRLSWPRRIWALVFLGAVLGRWSELAPWMVIVLLGYDLILAWDRDPPRVLPAAVILGFLSLFSLGHLLLAVLAVAIAACTARPPLAKALAALGFVVGLVAGWLALGQSLSGLGLWLQRGLPLLGQTSPATRILDLAPFSSWAVVTALGFIAVLALSHFFSPARTRSLPGSLFLAGAAWLAWKAIALQTHGTPLAFFGTVLLAGFVLWPRGGTDRWVAALVLLALTGLAHGHPEFLGSALSNFNRQLVYNWRQLSGGNQLRTDLRTQVASLRNVYAWPKFQALVGTETVGVSDDALPRAMYNNLPLVLRANAWAGPQAPAFAIQGLSASVELAPALTGSAAQLDLYRNYELLAGEAGFFLWRHRPTATPAPVLVATGTLRFGEPLKLPASDNTAYWLELNPRPGILGRLWSLLDEIPEPGLLARDDSGSTVRYALPPAIAVQGFLVDPLIRGNVEFAGWQRGAQPLRTAEVTVAAPLVAGWMWSGRYDYRLYAVSGLKLAGRALRDVPGVAAFRAFNRSPVGSAYTLPFVESPVETQEGLFFVHPGSLLEFVVTGDNRRIRGSFGIAPGAYDRPGRTDGVDFSVEFFGVDGSRQELLHRYLNPAMETGDRGVQEFELELPAGANGRVLLRTFNPPYRNAAWDWAFWRKVVIE